jgi:hypothetical protein
MNPLTVSDVQIQTATVSVKTLVLGGKPMTSAEFRQLPEQSIFAEVQIGNFASAPIVLAFDTDDRPWGLVSHFWPGCGMCGDHLHVVAARDGKPFRSCISNLGVCDHDKGFLIWGDSRGLIWLSERHRIAIKKGRHREAIELSAKGSVRYDAIWHEIGVFNKMVAKVRQLDQLFIEV